LSLATISSDEEDCFSYEETEELSPPPSPTIAPASHDMSRQQQQTPTAPTMEQILQYMAQQLEAITVLQQQLLATQMAIATTPAAPAAATAPAPVAAPIMEAALPPKFSGERGQVVGFINVCCLFIQMRMGQVGSRSRISWVLSYVQGGVAEIWKNNVLDEISKGTSMVNTEEELFTKIQQEFGEFNEESRKVDELRVLEQGGKTVDEYVQEFRRAARGSGYEGRALVEEFKRGLSGAIRRRLAEAEMPPTTIVQWQERAVQLDRNMRQSRAKEKILGGREGNTALLHQN